MASTSQLLNPYTRDWDRELMEKLGISARIFGEVKLPGTARGTLLPEIAKECGVAEIPVIAVGGHDTASAVPPCPRGRKILPISVPAPGRFWARRSKSRCAPKA